MEEEDEEEKEEPAPPRERSGPSAASVGTELRLPALVHPDELLDLVVSLGEMPDAATKWFLYCACEEPGVKVSRSHYREQRHKATVWTNNIRLCAF